MKRPDHHQVSLFTPTTTIVDEPKAPSPTTEPTGTDPNSESLNIEITRDELATQVIQGFVKHRRWEKELVVGASDEELSLALGNCWASNAHLHIHCNTDPAPHVICTTPMGQELLRLEAAEIATLVRTHAEIPTVPSEEERQRRLSAELDNQRAAARADIFTAVQGILGDNSRKREQGFTTEFVNLLFTENCLEEQNESATLETITAMLIKREWTRMKAMKAAIQLVERAAGTWRSVEGYWLNRPYF
jgi:hypothetical protein